jgi:malate dehydrogenase (oxaloacetate-decarboxylating)(NADP+)
MDPDKARFAQATHQRTLSEAIVGADIFLGLSAGGVLKAAHGQGHGRSPGDLRARESHAEILPAEGARGARRCRHGHGRSDYRNQVNKVLCFPVHFPLSAGCRRQTSITRAMEIRSVRAIALLARMGHSDVVASAMASPISRSALTT